MFVVLASHPARHPQRPTRQCSSLSAPLCYRVRVRPAKRQATYQDVIDAPPHMVAELIEGELYLQPRPAKPHTQTASVLGAQLLVAFQLGRSGPGGWWILDEPEVHLGDSVLVPDIAGWLRADVPAFDTSVAYYAEVPRWVAEVLSPSTERLDRIKKLRLYHQAGIAFVWLVHPVLRTLEVYERHEGGYLLIETHEQTATIQAQPFIGFDLDLSSLWLSVGGDADINTPSRS